MQSGQRQSEALALRGWARAERRRSRRHRADAAMLREALDAAAEGHWARLAGMTKASRPHAAAGDRSIAFGVEPPR